MMILAGDIGGTHTRLLLASHSEQALQVLYQTDFANQNYANFVVVLTEFFAAAMALNIPVDNIASSCFAVAGPIEKISAQRQRVQMTNLSWTLDSTELSERFSLAACVLINDFAAQVYGLDALADDDLCVLQVGESIEQGMRALIGAGTGLGMALAFCESSVNNTTAQKWRALPSQGGHSDFSPTDAAQLQLWQMLHAQYGRVSNELILSGAGLLRLYQARCVVDGVSPLFATPKQVSDAALAANNPQAVQALHQFAVIYGAVAGNLALLGLPFGGVYISGGIAPKILPVLKDGCFIQAFNAKVPLSTLLEKIPVYVVLNEHAGLFGAAHVAVQQFELLHNA